MRSARYITGLTMCLLVSACAVGPDFKSPKAPAVTSYTDTPLPAQTASAPVAGGEAQTFVNDKDVPANWWTLFGNEALNQLMEQGLKANPDLQAARASLKQARENVYAAQGVLLPSVDLDPSVTREKFSPAAFGETGAPSSIFTLYNASVSVSYGIDIFGGARREVESLRAQEDYQRYELDAAYLTLTGNIVTAAVQEASLREQVKASEAVVGALQKQLDIVGKQFEYGAIAKSVVLAQRTALAQAETALPPLQKQLAQKRDQLAVLIGHFPGEGVSAAFTLADLKLPQDLPMTLPSKLVEQRPDIKAAEAQLHSASAAIGVATAAMLPQITLSGSFGSETTQTGNLFTSPTQVWSLGAGLLQPIFHGGTLLHQKRAAVAAYEKAEAQYRSTVLSAFANVADTLRALQYDAEALKTQQVAAQSAEDSLALSREQYKDGAVSYPQLLSAEQAWQQSIVALAQAQAARYADTAALFEALGGSWNEKNLAVTPDAVKNESRSEKKS